MKPFPLKQRVKVLRSMETKKNRHGDLEEGFFPPKSEAVAGWAVPSTEETQSAELSGRVVIDLNLFAPPGIAGQHDEVLIGRDRYRVESVSDYQNGPFWAPGLEQYGLTRVEG